jgi:hypothetical protein
MATVPEILKSNGSTMAFQLVDDAQRLLPPNGAVKIREF